ncbi:zinc finger protein 596-like [Folsomia candida]|uniref:zinc finger protein 596-like n=1 Tax=Folsomia candida TaxID=158441 RepID=UPI0016051EA9|nr:zinc finger protein 596-like [Folsomia candida]
MDPSRRNLLECSKCKKTFKTNHDFKRHVKTHDPGAKVKCKVCGKISKHPATLSRHMANIHGKRDPSICHICEKPFSSSQHLKRHINEIHSTVDRPRMTCIFPGCEKSYLCKYEAMKHHRIEHSENPIQFPCILCGKWFNLRSKLHQHIPTHTTEKPYNCPICGRSFPHKASMKRHEKTHLAQSDRDVFQCDVCPQTFVRRDALQHHIRVVHENQRNYPCSICGKRFSVSAEVRNHMEARHSAHKGKIHSCDKCEYKSHSKAYLARHVRNHKIGKRHECYFCRKKVASFQILVRHCSRFHTLEK